MSFLVFALTPASAQSRLESITKRTQGGQPFRSMETAFGADEGIRPTYYAAMADFWNRLAQSGVNELSASV
jgi:hypothetical protein